MWTSPGDARGRAAPRLGPPIRDRKTEGDRVFAGARKQGFVRVRVDGESYDLHEAPTLDKYKRHTIEVVVDRSSCAGRTRPRTGRATRAGLIEGDRPGRRSRASRFADSVETRWTGRGPPGRGAGPARRRVADVGRERYSESTAACTTARRSRARAAHVLVQLAARRLPGVHGAGRRSGARPGPGHPEQEPEYHRGRVVALAANARPRARGTEGGRGDGRASASADGRPGQGPAGEHDRFLLYAPQGREGRIRLPTQRRRATDTRRRSRACMNRLRAAVPGDRVRVDQAGARELHGRAAVPACRGQRLKPEALGGDGRRRNISGRDCVGHRRARRARALPTRYRSASDTAQVLKEIVRRLGFLVDVGLDYLTINRTAPRCRAARRNASGWRPRSARADGRAVHPRRAVDRPAPEGQRPADRHARSACATWATRPRRRARRGNDPDRRLGDRHRARRGGARGRGHRRAARSSAISPSRGRSPARTCAATRSARPRQAPQGQRQVARRARAPAGTTCKKIEWRSRSAR